jgi:hypothetical protein
MRKAAMALGIMSALLSAYPIRSALSRWAEFPVGDVHVLVRMAVGDVLVLVVGIVGIVGIGGGVLALTRPVVAGTLMLITGIGGLIANLVFNLFVVLGPTFAAFFLLISGGVIALTAREKPAGRVVTMVLGILVGLFGPLYTVDWTWLYLRGGARGRTPCLDTLSSCCRNWRRSIGLDQAGCGRDVDAGNRYR